VSPPAHVPFLPLLGPHLIDDLFAFPVAALVAVLFNAEGQGWVATILGDAHEDKGQRLHFNFFLHLDPLGVVAFLLAGVGWPKWVPIDAKNFPRPRAFLAVSRLAGPAANLLLAAIAASIAFVLKNWGVSDRVFSMVAAVNVATAIYTLVPIPPMAGAGVLPAFRSGGRLSKRAYYSGSAVLLVLLSAERYTGFQLLTPLLDPIVRTITAYLLG
jgi:Zn-dependent protease